MKRIAILAALTTAGTVSAQEATKEELALFTEVMERLLATELVQKTYPSKYHFPPKYYIKQRSDKELNAYASSHSLHGAAVDSTSNKLRPVALITEGYMRKIVKGDGGILAAIMGHELGHLIRDHVGSIKGDTALLFWAFRRDQEIEADLLGMKYAVAAGYPYQAGIKSAIREMKIAGNYTSFEGLRGSHPTWEERLRFLDEKNPELWASMGAFENGFRFLSSEQYLAAEQCFRAVVREFPDCAEAWANLGYAMLMQYCDALDVDDIRRFGIGQVVVGAFYARPQSLEPPVRAIDAKLWKAAVKALEKAQDLDRKLVLPRANLGLAYLVHPEGKEPERALQYFQQALEIVGDDKGARALAIAACWINAGVAELARDNLKAAGEKFNRAQQIIGNSAYSPLRFTLEDALAYNQAQVALGAGDKRQAFNLLDKYLRLGNPNSAWWTLGYESYSKLGKDLGMTTKSQDELARRFSQDQLRLVASIKVGPDAAIGLSERTRDVVERLAGRQRLVALPLYPDSSIVRYRQIQPGVDLLAGDKILAIFLNKDEAPPILVQGKGLAGKSAELRVGMTSRELQDVVKSQTLEPSPRSIDNPSLAYMVYPNLGLAIREEGGRVVEFVITQIPRKIAGLK